MDFLVFSDDFGEHPSSCQHLFRHIAKEHRVLWVNTIGMRSPKLSKTDLNKALLKLRKMLGKHSQTAKHSNHDENISVVQPLMLPYAQLPLVRAFNRHSVVRRVQRELQRLDMENPILVTTVPNACDYVGAFHERKVVYYCVDDFAHWPGHDAKYITRLEEDLISKSDVFVATSQKLYERLAQSGKPTHLLTHGVDVEHFSQEVEQEHSVLQDIPSPRVGYFGLIDERMDQDLVRQVALDLPEISFVFTGRVEANCSRLNDLDNVYFSGPVAYEDLPAMIKGWDMCMLPYKVDEFSENINPLKLKEYLAAGKPAISTPLPAVTSMNGYVTVCAGSKSWVDEIQKDLVKNTRKKNSNNYEELMSFIISESWSNKADQLLARAFC